MASTESPRLGPVKELAELREKFRRGVSFEEFKKHYWHYQASAEAHAEFRRIDEAIQFLEDHGGYTYPEPRAGAWVTQGEAWVAVDGYLPLHHQPADRFTPRIEFRYLINVVGVRTRVLVFDDVTARVWQHVNCSPAAYEKALLWTLLIRTRDPADSRSIVEALQHYRDPEQELQTNEELAAQLRTHCHLPDLQELLRGDWVPAPRRLSWFDGSHHLLLLPSWLFRLDDSYTVTDWTFFL